MAFGSSRAAADSVVDTLQFGNRGSENAHGFNPGRSEVVDGALGVKARRLLPPDSEGWRGGRMTFRMAVDPEKQNYFTAKFWGGEVTGEHSRLMLFVDGKQVGQRHLGEVDPLDIVDDDPRFPKRFFYKTQPLPQRSTLGKQQVELAIEVQGPIWGYGPTIERYQHHLKSASRGVYHGYVHTDPFFEPRASEIQGDPASEFPVREGPGPEVLDAIKKRVNGAIAGLLKGGDGLGGKRTQFLAHACFVPWSGAYHNRQALNKIVRSVDHEYRKFAEDSKLIEKEWEGAGPFGDAVRLLAKPMQRYLDHEIQGTGKRRRDAWNAMFLASRDWHLRHRRAYTNQTMIVDTNIYRCNRAVAVLSLSDAWPESKALEILHEAVGLEYWSGARDERGRPSWRLGKRYLQLTEQGLTKELGYVGGYGEIPVPLVREMYESTRPEPKSEGDQRLKAQLVRIAKSRAVFRYPLPDSEGNRSMRMEAVIGWRDWHYPSSVTYDQMPTDDGGPMDVAAETMDPVLIGYGQQMMEDNQFFASLEKLNQRRGSKALGGLLRAPGNYERVKDYPKQTTRLPMAPGQPDFVFSDPGVGVVAIKRGETIFYASLYWRARYAVNDLARVHYLTPTLERDATIGIRTRFENSGDTYKMPNHPNAPFSRNYEGFYRDAGMDLATAGQLQPIAKVPGFMKDYRPGKENYFAGKGSLYEMEYGPYFVAMNCSYNRKFPVRTPEAFAGADDLTADGAPARSRYALKPRQTVVLYRGE